MGTFCGRFNSWGVLRRVLLPGWPLSWAACLSEAKLIFRLERFLERFWLSDAICPLLLAEAFSGNKSQPSIPPSIRRNILSLQAALVNYSEQHWLKHAALGASTSNMPECQCHFLLEPFCQWWTAAFDKTFCFGGVTELSNQEWMVPSTSSTIDNGHPSSAPSRTVILSILKYSKTIFLASCFNIMIIEFVGICWNFCWNQFYGGKFGWFGLRYPRVLLPIISYFSFSVLAPCHRQRGNAANLHLRKEPNLDRRTVRTAPAK